MKKPLFLMSLLASFMFSNSLNAQVGISKQTTFTPAESSILDVESADKGMLIPRVKLTATNNFAPLIGNIETSNSLLVYNTEISPTEVLVANKVTPGFYYWETDKWVRVINPNDQDLRLVGTNNHITKDAGVGGTGTSAGTGSSNIAIGKSNLNAITTGSDNIAIG